MRYGIAIPPFAEFSDVRALADLAREAEDAGWDGFYIWDHMMFGAFAIADPWVALTAIALATSRVLIGPMVTPVPRRRPVELARETVTLDHLSNGRLILGVGTGAGPWEYDYLGEEGDPKARGEMLDEGLEVLTRIWSGEPFSFDGKHYSIHGTAGWEPSDTPSEARFQPPALQSQQDIRDADARRGPRDQRVHTQSPHERRGVRRRHPRPDRGRERSDGRRACRAVCRSRGDLVARRPPTLALRLAIWTLAGRGDARARAPWPAA
jgi:hypothetical protein